MAANDLTTEQLDQDESSPELAAAAQAIGPLRNPDGCVQVCPDCTCRTLLERRRNETAAER